MSIRRKRIGRPRCERDLDMKISKYKMQRDYLCEHHIILGHALLKMRRTSDASKRMQYFLSYFYRLTIHYPLHFFRFIFLFKNIFANIKIYSLYNVSSYTKKEKGEMYRGSVKKIKLSEALLLLYAVLRTGRQLYE